MESNDEKQDRDDEIRPSPQMHKVSAAQLTRMELEARSERERDYLVSQWDEVFGS